jgi:SAM-dependent methyltransferase
MTAGIDRSFGRRAFGADPAKYHAARPAYPEWVFQRLSEACGLRPGAAVFEIGAGTGTATRQLLSRGADPLIAIEPDPRLAAFLRQTITDQTLQISLVPFEEAELAEVGFDLGVAATSFHWLEEDAALAKIARLLRPGG